eukprot:gene18053-22099_t
MPHFPNAHGTRTATHVNDSTAAPLPTDDISTPRPDGQAMRDAILRKLTYDLGKSRSGALDRDWFMATALAVRDRVVEPWLNDMRSTYNTGQKQVYYLSLEFLIGRLLRDN